jgi:TrfA protein
VKENGTAGSQNGGRVGRSTSLAPDLAKALNSLSVAMTKASPTRSEPTEAELLEKLFQFPLWPEPVRGMPNPALRSALFSAIQSKDRRWLDNELIAAVNGIEIRFHGKQLNQEDLEVCAEIFHMARTRPLGNTCHTSAHALLKALGRSTGRTNHRQLHASLIRLQQPLEIKIGHFHYSGSFIEKGIKDDLTRHYALRVNPDLASLFQNGWTALDIEQRHVLRGKSLALWLHAFYASHARPYPYKVMTLRDLCGSRTSALFHYREKLKCAHRTRHYVARLPFHIKAGKESAKSKRVRLMVPPLMV